MQLLSHVKKSSGDKKMKKILMPGDSIIIDGVELTTEELKTFLTERVIFKKQLETVKSIAQGGVE